MNIAENLGIGIVQDYWNEYADSKFNKNPYIDEKTGKKLRLPPDITKKEEQRKWLKFQKRAWIHDNCFLGSCGVGLSVIGLAPLLSFFFPVIGPLIMYAVHLNLVRLANEEIHIPNKLIAQMQSQIAFDLLITLPPFIGGFFSWMNGCLTKNAATIYGFMITNARERASGIDMVYIRKDQATGGTGKPKSGGKSKRNVQDEENSDIIIGDQQQSGYV